ncbi:MAG: site-specific integrase [Acidobacteriia bacterium]|nr:site-specific integrase [Terriglobia bacterium]
MSIYRRGGKYWYSFVFNGRRVQASTKVGNKNDARDIEKAAWTQLARGEVGLPVEGEKKLTTTELLDALEKHYRSEGKASPQNLSTLAVARGAFGKKKTLTKADVDQYIERRLGEGARPATVNRVIEVVRRAFRLAKQVAPEMRHLREDNAREGFFACDELDRVVYALPEDLKDFVRFTFATAWRKGEVASLRWSDVEDCVIRLRAANSKNREARQVVIDGDLIDIVKRRRAVRAVETPDGTALCEYIFHRNGDPVKEFRKSWARACVAAGVGKMVCPKCKSEGNTLFCTECKMATKYCGRIVHDLRRSGVRDMIRSGVPQSVAMKISGHKTASMFRRYDITSESDLRQAMLSVQKYREAERQKVSVIAGK